MRQFVIDCNQTVTMCRKQSFEDLAKKKQNNRLKQKTWLTIGRISPYSNLRKLLEEFNLKVFRY